MLISQYMSEETPNPEEDNDTRGGETVRGTNCGHTGVWGHMVGARKRILAPARPSTLHEDANGVSAYALEKVFSTKAVHSRHELLLARTGSGLHVYLVVPTVAIRFQIAVATLFDQRSIP